MTASADASGATAAQRRSFPQRSLRVLGGGLGAAWSWFRAFRRTRPFWGAMWTIIAGLEIARSMSFDVGLALTGGWSYAAGYVMGGGLVLFGLVSIVTPHYKSLAGVVAFLIALAAFPTANLGGYLLGSVLGVIGSSMIWSWGPKRPRRSRSGEVDTDGARPEGEALA